MTGVTVRAMEAAELDAVAELWWASLDDSSQWLRPDQKHTKAESLDFFRGVVARQCQLWVAVREDALVGVLALRDSELDRLYVATDAQGQGVGSALLDHAKAVSPTGLILVTLQGNTQARRFYERRGFESYDVGQSPPPENEPDIWYRWPSSSGTT